MMKTMKKLASIVLALVMALALAAPAFADDTTTTVQTGTITIKNPENTPEDATHTYTVYRVFEMTMATGEDGKIIVDDNNVPTTVSYTARTAVKDLIENIAEGDKYAAVKGYFTFEAIANDSDNWTVIPTPSFKGETAAKTFAEFLKGHTDSLTLIQVDNKNTIALTGADSKEITVPYGYYFVNSTVGSLVMLDSSTPEVEIADKNVDPTIEKTSNDTDDSKQVGDEVVFTITVKVQPGAKDYVVHDTMGTGLTLGNKDETKDVAVTGLKAATETDPGDYTVNYNPTHTEEDQCDFEVIFTQDYLDSVEVATELTITYTAVINENAVTVKIGNEAKLTYGGDNTITTSTKANVYFFDLVKTNKDFEILDGAEFELTRLDADNNPETVYFTKSADGNTYTVVAAGTKGATSKIEAGNVRIQGLGAVVYTLTETKAPKGYNALTEPRTVDMTEVPEGSTAPGGNKEAHFNGESGKWTEGGVQVTNLTGSVLPSTGGIGTTIFYVGGGILVVGAVILLITKKRMGSAD